MNYEFAAKPEKCPLCGASTIVEIRYGLIWHTPELDKEIDEGKCVMGGCISHSASPKWLCKTCNTEMYKSS